MYYVYQDSIYGTELIGQSETLAGAEKIKADRDKEWKPGYLWSTRITEKRETEHTYFD